MRIEPSIVIAIVLGFLAILIIIAAYRRRRKPKHCRDDIEWWLDL